MFIHPGLLTKPHSKENFIKTTTLGKLFLNLNLTIKTTFVKMINRRWAEKVVLSVFL
jgi:hypothetical protein